MFLAGDGGLAVGGGGDHLLDRSLGVPSVVPEIGGQPVDQVGVGGPISLRSEVARGVGKPPAEDGLPMTIGGDSCRQGMFGVDQPLGHAESGFRKIFLHRRKEGGCVGQVFL